MRCAQHALFSVRALFSSEIFSLVGLSFYYKLISKGKTQSIGPGHSRRSSLSSSVYM